MKIDPGIPLQLAQVPDAARSLEQRGYDAGWCGEINHDPFLPLVLAAEHTERLELGTSIAVAFARNPMTIANVAWDLQAYSQGRATRKIMTPMFVPEPQPHGLPPIFLSAVGEAMTELCGEVADGVHTHAFTTERYLREVTEPALRRGLDRAGRDRGDLRRGAQRLRRRRARR